MKKNILFVAIIIASTILLGCESTTTNSDDISSTITSTVVIAERAEIIDTELIINNIKASVATINSRSDYKTVEKDIIGRPSEGARLTGYYNNDSLVKTFGEYYGTISIGKIESYYQNGDLIFLFRQNEIYDDIIVGLNAKLSHTEEDKFYFSENKLIKWINKNDEIVEPDSDEFLKTEGQINFAVLEDIKILNSEGTEYVY